MLRPDWISDGLSSTLVVVLVVALIAMYFSVVRGWSW
jgi:hypothetical protein